MDLINNFFILRIWASTNHIRMANRFIVLGVVEMTKLDMALP